MRERGKFGRIDPRLGEGGSDSGRVGRAHTARGATERHGLPAGHSIGLSVAQRHGEDGAGELLFLTHPYPFFFVLSIKF